MKLQSKQSPGWTNSDGTVIAPHTLYRYVDENGKGGCWYAKIENAQKSWHRAHGDHADDGKASEKYGGH